jgi:uncharacterized protein with FMN-binding domain
MLKGRGKGKISNDLVAASCVAVLAVFAAGYSRTRDAARRFETQAKERRAAARAERTADNPRHAVIEPPASAMVVGPKAALPVVTRKPAARKAGASTAFAALRRAPASVPVSAIDSLTVAEEPSAPGAPPVIAPVPLPAADTTAPAAIAITRGPVPSSAPKWRDGTYTGLGDSPHGDIEARVVIKDGRIVEAGITACDTRYPCSVIDPLLHQPVERQSPDVDYMSHATESSDAYYDALVAALEIAVERPAGEATIPR